MTKSLTQLVSLVQAQLIDDGTRFTTATITAAIRQTLTNLNARLPINAGARITVIANQHEYELTDEDELAVGITDILKWSDDEKHQPLPYDPYTEDERWFFRLRTPLQTGEILARYPIHHTVNGLDSQTETTLSSDLCQILTDGACAASLNFRRLSRVETINLQKDVPDNYTEAIKYFIQAYELGIKSYELRRSPVSEPRTDAWNDKYHYWNI